jgi:hypothetical protein
MRNPRHYHLTAQDGQLGPKLLLNNAYSFRWGLRLGKPGILDVVLPARGCKVNPLGDDQAYDTDQFKQNHWLFLTRTYGITGTRTRVGPGPFLVSSIELEKTDDGLKVIKLHAETAMSVLYRRINPYDGDDARSDFPPIFADDFAKEIVRNNFLAAASSHVNAPGYAPDPLRDASGSLLVQANVSAAAAAYEPNVENAEILRAIQAACDYSYSKGTAMFFDIFFTGGTPAFEFRTMVTAYGVDRSVAGPNLVKIHSEIDMSSYKISTDWTRASNRVYAGARGATGAARVYAVSPVPASADGIDLAATVAIDPFALREKFESSTADDLAGTQSEADSARTAANTVFSASGKLNENGRLTYGIDFDFGDKLLIVIDGGLFPGFTDSGFFTGFAVSEVGQVDRSGEETLEIGFSTDPLPRVAAGGVAGVLFDLSRITASLEKISRTE